MRRNKRRIDKQTQYLLSNGDISAFTSQELYEITWSMGRRPLNESGLKPDFLTKRKRRRVGDSPTSSHYRLKAMRSARRIKNGGD